MKRAVDQHGGSPRYRTCRVADAIICVYPTETPPMALTALYPTPTFHAGGRVDLALFFSRAAQFLGSRVRARKGRWPETAAADLDIVAVGALVCVNGAALVQDPSPLDPGPWTLDP
ncbi:hypothetical protein VDGL01_08987 [Verticillium dahliae]